MKNTRPMHFWKTCSKNLDEVHAPASGIEQRLCREFEGNMYSWDHEFGDPQNISDTKQRHEVGEFR